MDKGQTVIEYILLVGIVTLALVLMGTDIKRGVQSTVKVMADQIGAQVNADQDMGPEDSYLASSLGNARVGHQQTKTDRIGVTATQTTDFMETNATSTSVTNFLPDANR